MQPHQRDKDRRGALTCPDWVLNLYVRGQLRTEFLRDERGQDLVEYALVLGVIVLASVAGMTAIATKVNAVFTTVGSKLTTYTT